ncbi:MAG TPA: HAD family hydrolase [Anaerolineaceae bacterium]|nr:HAD family hydrolase [Anaerolineaceae bacterium]
MIRWIAFDADDTLWENEKYYHDGQLKLAQILAEYQPTEIVDAELLKTETNNMPWYGYGIKAFGLSMIETAIRLSNGKVGSNEISIIIDHLRSMLAQPAELLPGVLETLELIKPDYRLMVITKGDLLDQERKLTNSQLEGFFEAYEVVSNKDDETYNQILKRHGIKPNEFIMVGNSLRSDILPVVNIGGYGVYIPHRFTWAHEVVNDVSSHSDGFIQIESFKDLPNTLENLKNQ